MSESGDNAGAVGVSLAYYPFQKVGVNAVLWQMDFLSGSLGPFAAGNDNCPPIVQI